MKHLQWLLMLALATPMMISCGSDDDDDGGGGAQQEEAPPGGGTSGGTSGGSSGGSGGGTACISSTSKRNIRNVMDKVAGLTSVQGEAHATERLNDGTVLTFQGIGGYTLSKPRNDSWRADGEFCDAGDCFGSEWSVQIRDDGCFYSDGFRARIISTSSTRISFSFFNEDGDRVQDSISLMHGDQLHLRETVTRNGVVRLNFRFDPL